MSDQAYPGRINGRFAPGHTLTLPSAALHARAFMRLALSADIVRDIARCARSRLPRRLIYARYPHIKSGTIKKVLDGLNWKHITGGKLCGAVNQRLTARQVSHIKLALAQGARCAPLARQCAVSRGCITGILYLHNWRHILPGVNETLRARIDAIDPKLKKLRAACGRLAHQRKGRD